MIPRGICLALCAVAALAAPPPLQAPTALLLTRAEMAAMERNQETLTMLQEDPVWVAYFTGRRDVYRELGAIIDRAAP